MEIDASHLTPEEVQIVREAYERLIAEQWALSA